MKKAILVCIVLLVRCSTASEYTPTEGYDHKELHQAYEKAVESKKYESLLHISGRSKRAYALNNDQEYFAECSEAFLGTNDFYPFVRSELQRHDEEMYKLLRKLWKTK